MYKYVNRGGVNLIVYHGKKYNEEKEPYWNNVDIFVFPTQYENECFALVLLEAMQHKLPVVTTAEGGIPDIIKDGINGFIVSTPQAKDLAEKIKLLLNNPNLRTQFGNTGFEIYKKEFTLTHFENNLKDCLKSCIHTNLL